MYNEKLLRLLNGMYDSIPTINSNSKFVLSAYHNEHSILKHTCQTSTRTWNQQFRTLQLDNEDMDVDQEYRYFLSRSDAPYGYEHEPAYSDENIKSIGTTGGKYRKYVQTRISHTFDYENDKVIKTRHFKMRATYMKETNLVSMSIIKKHTMDYVYFKETKKLVRLVNNKLTYDERRGEITRTFKECLTNYLKQTDPRLHTYVEKDISIFSSYSRLRKVLRNPMWVDLNDPHISDISGGRYDPNGYYDRGPVNKLNRIRYAYKKHGTKRAREVYYETTNKGLIKLYQDIKPGKLADHVLPTMGYLQKNLNQPLDKCIALLKLTLENKGLNFFNLSFFKQVEKIKEYYPHISYEKIVKKSQGGTSYYSYTRELTDIFRYLVRIEDLQKQVNTVIELPKCNDLDFYSLSTRLSFVINSFADKKDLLQYTHTKVCEELYNKDLGAYSFKFANSNKQLVDCGNALSICVGGYKYNAERRSCDIVFVYKQEAPNEVYCCVEISPRDLDSDKPTYSLRQAKLRRNNRASSDPELNEVILNWMDMSGIILCRTQYDIKTEEEVLKTQQVVRGAQANQIWVDDAFAF